MTTDHADGVRDAVLSASGSSLIEHDAPCALCGYNLRGLDVEGRCPECGSSVLRSMRGDLLLFSAAAHLRTIMRGCALARIAGWLLLVFYVLLGLLSVAVLILSATQQALGISGEIELAILLTILLLSGFDLIAWWMLSSRDPRLTRTDRGVRARRVVRIALSASVAVYFALVIVAAPFTTLRIASPAETILSVAALAIVLLQFVAKMLYLRWIAQRVPSTRLTWHIGRLLWILPLVYAVGWIIVVIGPIIACVLYVRVLSRTMRELREVRSAQNAYLREEPPPVE